MQQKNTGKVSSTRDRCLLISLIGIPGCVILASFGHDIGLVTYIVCLLCGVGAVTVYPQVFIQDVRQYRRSRSFAAFIPTALAIFFVVFSGLTWLQFQEQYLSPAVLSCRYKNDEFASPLILFYENGTYRLNDFVMDKYCWGNYHRQDSLIIRDDAACQSGLSSRLVIRREETGMPNHGYEYSLYQIGRDGFVLPGKFALKVTMIDSTFLPW